jgi:hypothetical protein
MEFSVQLLGCAVSVCFPTMAHILPRAQTWIPSGPAELRGTVSGATNAPAIGAWSSLEITVSRKLTRLPIGCNA